MEKVQVNWNTFCKLRDEAEDAARDARSIHGTLQVLLNIKVAVNKANNPPSTINQITAQMLSLMQIEKLLPVLDMLEVFANRHRDDVEHIYLLCEKIADFSVDEDKAGPVEEVKS
jgi:hypothetical protein